MDRTLVMIDGPSLFYSARDLNCHVDYAALKQYLEEQYSVVAIRYYNLIPRGEKTSVTSLSHHLTRLGYSCICPEVDFSEKDDGSKQYNTSVRSLILGDLNTVMRESLKVESVVLISHDSNLGEIMSNLQLMGIRTHLMGTRRSDPPRVSYSLISKVGNFVDLMDCNYFMNCSIDTNGFPVRNED